MKIISLCFFLALFLPLAHAAEKDCLPTGETAANFLIRQVGGGYAELTTDTQQKKPLQLLMEEIVLADGRDKAPGKWIDDIPDTLPPALPDIPPLITSSTLFIDAAGANAHWDAFLKRHYFTGNYLLERKVQPKILRKLSPDILEWIHAMQNSAMSRENYKTQAEYLADVGEALLYADFVFAHGDAEAKGYATLFMRVVQERLTYGGEKDSALAQYVARECLWPMLHTAPDKFGIDNRFKLVIWQVLCDALKNNTKDRVRLEKWQINRAGWERLRANGPLAKRANLYSEVKDYVGALICHMANVNSDVLNLQRLQLIHSLLKLQYGKEKGSAYYKRFLDCEIALSKNPKNAQDELAALQKGAAAPKPQK